MSLQSKLKEIEDLKKRATAKIDYDQSTAPVQEANRRNAKEKLNQEVLGLQIAVLQNSLFLVVTGDKREEFAQIASEFDVFSNSYDDFYKLIVDSIAPNAWKGVAFGPQIVDQINAVMAVFADNAGITNYDPVVYKTSMDGGSTRDPIVFQANVKKFFERNLGADYSVVSALSNTTRKIAQEGFKWDTVPLLITADKKDAEMVTKAISSLTGRFVLIHTDEDGEGINCVNPTEKSVKESLLMAQGKKIDKPKQKTKNKSESEKGEV